MTKKIFRSTVVSAAVILVFGITLVMAALYQYLGKEIDSELEKEGEYLSYGVEADGVTYLEQIKNSDARITYIAQDGTVLYDSQADISKMKNHSDRKEFQ